MASPTRSAGHVLAVTAASLHVLLYLLVYRSDIITDVGVLISFVFDVARAPAGAPDERDYRRIWFKYGAVEPHPAANCRAARGARGGCSSTWPTCGARRRTGCRPRGLRLR
jgi:hypothetical protein